VVPARGDSQPAETLARQPGVADRGRSHALTEKVGGLPADHPPPPERRDLALPAGRGFCA
jgi:hypothetical protein